MWKSTRLIRIAPYKWRAGIAPDGGGKYPDIYVSVYPTRIAITMTTGITDPNFPSQAMFHNIDTKQARELATILNEAADCFEDDSDV